jgi:hypothetical protein
MDIVDVTYTTDTTNERWPDLNLNTSWTPASIITILRRFKLACIFTTSVACCLLLSSSGVVMYYQWTMQFKCFYFSYVLLSKTS